MKYEVVTDSVDHVLTLDEIKSSFVPITHNEHDARLTMLRNAAENFVSNATRRGLMTKTVDIYFGNWDCVNIELRPNVSVTNVFYVGDEGYLVELESLTYEVDNKGLDTRIVFHNTPNLGDAVDRITVRCTFGYGELDEYGVNPVPDNLRAAVGFLVAHWYNQTEPVVTGTTIAELPFHLQAIIDQYRVAEV